MTFAWAEDSTYTAATAHLVDANGKEYQWVGNTLREIATPAGHSYAKMNVKVSAASLSRVSGSDPISDDEKINVAGTYTFVLSKSAGDTTKVHILSAEPTTNGDWIPNSDATISLTVTISAADGSISFDSNGVNFWYTFDGLQGEAQGSETVANKTADSGYSITFKMDWE